jgi:hypothetical protein
MTKYEAERRERERALFELQAIDSVRLELKAAITGGEMGMFEIHEVHTRLMSLYASLGVDNIESIILKIDYKREAA